MSRDRVPIEEVPRPESLNGWMAIAWAEDLVFRLERHFDNGDRYLLELPNEKIKAEGPELLGVVESVFRMWLASSAGEALRERLWTTRPQGYREWAPQATARLEWSGAPNEQQFAKADDYDSLLRQYLGPSYGAYLQRQAIRERREPTDA